MNKIKREGDVLLLRSQSSIKSECKDWHTVELLKQHLIAKKHKDWNMYTCCNGWTSPHSEQFHSLFANTTSSSHSSDNHKILRFNSVFHPKPPPVYICNELSPHNMEWDIIQAMIPKNCHQPRTAASLPFKLEQLSHLDAGAGRCYWEPLGPLLLRALILRGESLPLTQSN